MIFVLAKFAVSNSEAPLLHVVHVNIMPELGVIAVSIVFNILAVYSNICLISSLKRWMCALKVSSSPLIIAMKEMT